jgi:hypothetical protein
VASIEVLSAPDFILASSALGFTPVSLDHGSVLSGRASALSDPVLVSPGHVSLSGQASSRRRLGGGGRHQRRGGGDRHRHPGGAGGLVLGEEQDCSFSIAAERLHVGALPSPPMARPATAQRCRSSAWHHRPDAPPLHPRPCSHRQPAGPALSRAQPPSPFRPRRLPAAAPLQRTWLGTDRIHGFLSCPGGGPGPSAKWAGRPDGLRPYRKPG